LNAADTNLGCECTQRKGKAAISVARYGGLPVMALTGAGTARGWGESACISLGPPQLPRCPCRCLVVASPHTPGPAEYSSEMGSTSQMCLCLSTDLETRLHRLFQASSPLLRHFGAHTAARLPVLLPEGSEPSNFPRSCTIQRLHWLCPFCSKDR